MGPAAAIIFLAAILAVAVVAWGAVTRRRSIVLALVALGVAGLPFLARRAHTPVDRLAVVDLTADRLRLFLKELEEKRRCGVATRNQRLAAIRSMAHFIGVQSPEHVAWCGQIRAIPIKKAPHPGITYLEKPEMDAVLAAPDRKTAQGQRDYVVLLFLYNTGARADEAAHVLVNDLDIPHVLGRDPSSVRIRGKGNKSRRCPLPSSSISTFMVGSSAIRSSKWMTHR